jgi:hypothetical protein
MSPDQRPGQRPEWADQERANDFAWIGENAHILRPAALVAFEEVGRGALIVDTTVTVDGRGHPFGYFPQEIVEADGDKDIKRMVQEYYPADEFVVSLLKGLGRISTYRVRPLPRQHDRPTSPHPFSLS